MNKNNGVYLKVLGCRLNQAEGEEWLPGQRVATPAEATRLVLHGCAVTSRSERKARQLIYRWQRQYPQKKITVTGCLARHWQRQEINLPTIELVVEGWPEVGKLPLIETKKKLVARTRRTLKMQDGCPHQCSYCIVPQLRVQDWNIKATAAFAKIHEWTLTGTKEIVLSGLHLGSYRDEEYNLTRWLTEAVTRLGQSRLRLSSIEPNRVTDELLILMRDKPKSICPHLHLPLQSGSAKILKSMNRPYNRALLSECLARVRKYLPDIALTADLIVGFPGESETDFEETLRLVKEFSLTRTHIFPFSPRPGTRAADLTNQLDHRVVRDRIQRLQDHCANVAREYRQRFIGTRQQMLIERKGNKGYTEYYQETEIEERRPENSFMQVEITDVTPLGLRARVASNR